MLGIFLLCILSDLSVLKISGAEPTECDEAFVGRIGSGVIKSYNFPFDYRHNLTCTYRIHLPSHPSNAEGNSQICFTFFRFDLESTTPFCSFDYLKFHTKDNRFDHKYCGLGWWQYGESEDDNMATVWSSHFCWVVKTDHFDITFISDNNENRGGFYAEFNVYTNGQVPPSPATGVAEGTSAPCGSDDWTCFNRRCVARSDVCDGRDTCGDGSDESYVHARCGEENVMACDFFSQGASDGYCGFRHEGWFRTSSLSPYGPKGDHTNTTHGYYVYTDVYETSAYLLSPEMTLPRNQPYCLTFWFYLYGSPPSAKLSVYVSRDQAYSRPEWSRELSRDTGWQQAQVSFSTQAQLQVIFAAELDNKFSGIALDDITVFSGKCRGDDIACNFESGLCAWESVNTLRHKGGNLRADMEWRVNGPSLGASKPTFDKSSTDGGGYFIFMNHSGESVANSRALLYSPPVSQFSNSRQCLRFYYYMDGTDKNCCLLTVKLHGTDDSLSSDMWSKYGDNRNAWNTASVQLDIGTPFQVILEGVVQRQGTIALDSVYLADGECGDSGTSRCESGQYLCAHGTCIDGALKCNNYVDCEDGSDEDWHASCPTTTTTEPSSYRTDISVEEMESTEAATTTTSTSRGAGPCSPDKHYCEENGECISSEWVCDGINDCPSKSDERGCSVTTPLPTCPDGSFRCSDGACVPMRLLCDGRADCADQSDEGQLANCPVTSTTSPCLRGEFLCRGSNACVARSRTCDGVKDCDDGSDEDRQIAKCAAAISDSGLGAGGAAGVTVAVLVLVIAAVLLVVFLLRRRQKKRTPPSRAETVSTIAISTNGDSLSGQNGVQPPPYAAEQGSALPSGAEGSEPEEPPPPYDAVLKDQRTNRTRAESDNNQNNVLQQSWQATAVPQLPQPSSVDRRSTRSMPGSSRRRAGSLPHARRVSAAHESVYVPRKYVPDPTENPPFQRSQSMFPERTRPLPRPPGTYSVYPPRGSGHGRIKLGTTALQPRGPRNYMNQGIHSDDSDSTITTDHIYETLNLPSDSDNQSRCGSVHALNHSSASRHSNPRASQNSCDLHVRNASCSSDVFEPDSGINSSLSSFQGSRSSHPYGPGYRPNMASPYSAETTSPMNSTHARILYPNNAFNKLSNHGRDKNSILYRPASQRRDSNPPYSPGSQNIDRHKQNKMYSFNYPGSANAMPMQYLGGQSGHVHNNKSLQSTPLQTMPLAHNSTQNNSCSPLSNPTRNAGISAFPSQTPVNKSAATKHSFQPVPENERPIGQSTQWQSPQHERNDSVLSARDLPTPDSQSNLIPSSNNSSFDQTQPSVVFLTDAETLLMNPTSV